MSSHTVRDLPQLLSGYLGRNKTITDTKISRLTPPGENFGSVMLKLDITLLNKETNTEEMLHTVAKILPETELFRKIFNVQVTYTNEMAFYDIVVPCVQNFQRKMGVPQVLDCVCKCIATRKNLSEDGDHIDDDAVLVLENLIENGFKNIERTKGFDFETTKLVLKDIALFHAVFLALKMKEPETFIQKVKPFCHDYKAAEDGGNMKDCIKVVVKEKEDIAHLASKIKTWGEIERRTPEEPLSTVIHTDLWVNNTMQKFENEKAVANKLVDFQVYTYGSPAADLFFFLWTSVSMDVLKQNLDYFIEFYFENFIEILKEHQCDTSQFTFKTS
ncbi:hypothetical protein JTB14_017916 [Gonioctena quinquepunctata]|nr:hypothetical protein JTB14_017916 [Gonioctena quinquepunctata]